MKLDHAILAIIGVQQVLEHRLGLRPLLHLHRQHGDPELEFARRLVFVPQTLKNRARIAITLLFDVELRQRALRRTRRGVSLDERFEILDGRGGRLLGEDFRFEQCSSVPRRLQRQCAIDRLGRGCHYADVAEPGIQRRERHGELRLGDGRVGLCQHQHKPVHRGLVGFLGKQPVELQKCVGKCGRRRRRRRERLLELRFELDIDGLRHFAHRPRANRRDQLLRTLRRPSRNTWRAAVG